MSRLSKGITGLSSYSRHGASQSQSVANDRSTNKSFEDLKRLIHGKLVDKLDLSRVSDLQGDTLRREIRLVVERLATDLAARPFLSPAASAGGALRNGSGFGLGTGKPSHGGI